MKNLLTLIVLAALISQPHLHANDEASSKKVNGPKGKEYVFDDSLGDRGIMEIYFPPDHDPSKPVPGIILLHECAQCWA